MSRQLDPADRRSRAQDSRAAPANSGAAVVSLLTRLIMAGSSTALMLARSILTPGRSHDLAGPPPTPPRLHTTVTSQPRCPGLFVTSTSLSLAEALENGEADFTSIPSPSSDDPAPGMMWLAGQSLDEMPAGTDEAVRVC